MSKVFTVIALLFSYQAYALPLPKPGFTAQQLPSSMSSDYDFEGIVALDNCSGSIVRYETSKDSDHAMVLTNGHCLEFGFTSPGKVVSNKPSSRSFRVLDAQSNNLGRITASEVIYSTMTKTDMTLYKTVETYAEIEKQYHVRPFTLASTHPETRQNIEVISGYWKKGYSCGIEAFIPTLKEDEWTFKDSIRYSRPGCDTIGGTSGSPIILEGSRTVIGVNNTGNEDGGECGMNNPCEVDNDGKVTFEKGYSYGQQTFWLYSCLNDKLELDLKRIGCQLQK